MNSVWGGHCENVFAPCTWCSMLSDIDHRPEGIITRHRATKITVPDWSPDARSSINIEQGPVYPSTERNPKIVWNIKIIAQSIWKEPFWGLILRILM